MTTNFKRVPTKELNKLVFAYILDCINSDGYDQEPKTDSEKLQFLRDAFHAEYVYPENLKRYGSYQNLFAEWLMGLPSAFHIDFSNYAIIKIAKNWGSIPEDATEAQEDKILSNWWNFIAHKTFQLMKKNGVNPF